MGRRTHTKIVEAERDYVFWWSKYGQPKVPFTKAGWRGKNLYCPMSFFDVLISINWDRIMEEPAWKPGQYIWGQR